MIRCPVTRSMAVHMFVGCFFSVHTSELTGRGVVYVFVHVAIVTW